MITLHPLVAYIGPETVVPVTSALAALGGALLLLPRYVGRFATWCLRKVSRTDRAS
jgi:hypothetical protein